MSTVDKAILVMLSGGLDSTYVLYKYLRETDLPVHAHHISMRVAQENRWQAEDRASDNVRFYCSDHYRCFSYSSTIYDFELPYTGWDADIQVTVGARVAANLGAKEVVTVLGINADDLKREEVIERSNRRVLDNLWTAMRESIPAERRDRIYPKLHLPFKDVPKWQMMDEMPGELVEMTWSCRKPIHESTPCGNCHACQARLAAYHERQRQRDMRQMSSDEIGFGFHAPVKAPKDD